MKDFAEIMDKMPDFELTDRTFMDSSIYDCKFYKHKNLDIWVTDFDVPNGTHRGGNLSETNKFFIFNEGNKKGCYISNQMLDQASSDKLTMDYILNQII